MTNNENNQSPSNNYYNSSSHINMHKRIHQNKEINILKNFRFNDFESSLSAQLEENLEEIEETDVDIEE